MLKESSPHPCQRMASISSMTLSNPRHRHFAPLADRLRSVIARERQIPMLLAAGKANIEHPPPAFVEIAIRNWTAPRLANVIGQLAEAAFAMRQQAPMAPTIAHRALVAIAVNARRRA